MKETLDEFIPHARCTRELRNRIDEVAELTGVKPTTFVRGCVEFVLSGMTREDFRIVRDVPDSRSGERSSEEEE